MNDNAKKWIKALRSGEYKQGKEKLRVAETYCCLGVACELFNRETGEGEWVETNQGFDFSASEYDVNDVVLPKAVRDWLRLSSYAGHAVILDDVSVSLDKLNDTGKDFNYIADFIVEHQDKLFT